MAKLPAFLSHTDNAITTASVSLATTSTASATYPASNMQQLPITKVWRGANAALTNVDITVDFGSTTVGVNLIALVNHNLSATATIAIAAGTTTGYANYSATMTFRQYDAWATSATQTYRYWRIRITDTSNADSFIEVGYLLMGLGTTLTQSFIYGWRQIDDYQNLEVASEFGVPYVNEMFYRMRFLFTFRNQTTARMDIIRAIFRGAKRNVVPLFFIPNITSGTDGYFGRFVSNLERQMDFLTTTNALEFVEDSRGKKIAA